jgi:hypothetical protein
MITMLILCTMLKPTTGRAIDFFFQPDTSFGNIADTITLSAQIGASDTLRGFTIYMEYDTNVIDLAYPPLPGTLLAGRPGLDFRYSDHIPAAPNWLEVGATIFGTSFWAGPGQLFTIRFALRQCANEVITADVGFRRPDASFILGDYNPPLISICPPSPIPPQAASNLVIYPNDPSSVILRWNPVTLDSLGNPLGNPPSYNVMRQQILPTELPPATVATVPDTFYVDPYDVGEVDLYYIITQTNP